MATSFREVTADIASDVPLGHMGKSGARAPRPSLQATQPGKIYPRRGI
jgi:hypothetical protein